MPTIPHLSAAQKASEHRASPSARHKTSPKPLRQPHSHTLPAVARPRLLVLQHACQNRPPHPLTLTCATTPVLRLCLAGATSPSTSISNEMIMTRSHMAGESQMVGWSSYAIRHESCHDNSIWGPCMRCYAMLYHIHTHTHTFACLPFPTRNTS